MKLTQYQIDLFSLNESQVEFINWLLILSHSEWMNAWINAVRKLDTIN